MTSYAKNLWVMLGVSVGAHIVAVGVVSALTIILALNEQLRKFQSNKLEVKQQETAQSKEEMPRLVFVETDATDEKADAPKNAKFYSARSTRAANPQPDEKRGESPKLDGKETRVTSTADVSLLPKEEKPQSPSAEKKAEEKPSQKPVEVAKLDPVKIEIPEIKERKTESPAEGKGGEPKIARVTRQIPAQLSEQKQTSVARRGRVALDVKGSPFGAYDQRLQEEVSRRWHTIVQQYEYGERTGVVEIYFRLHATGRIENLNTQNNTAGAVLGQHCKKAIDDSAPFEPFPEELRALLSQPHRDIIFTFYY